MKFTEGYWEKNELANASYAVQNFSVQQIPGGMRVVMPFHPVPDRAAALDVGTITTEFTFPARDVIRVTSRHFQGYESHSPRLPLTEAPQPVTFSETDRAATLSSGRMCV